MVPLNTVILCIPETYNRITTLGIKMLSLIKTYIIGIVVIIGDKFWFVKNVKNN